MQIVIDIDPYVLEHCKRHVEEHYANNIEEAIANGTPLPEGHGDLIDRSKLEVHYVGTDIGTDCPVYLLPTVDEALPIIKADVTSKQQ